MLLYTLKDTEPLIDYCTDYLIKFKFKYSKLVYFFSHFYSQNTKYYHLFYPNPFFTQYFAIFTQIFTNLNYNKLELQKMSQKLSDPYSQMLGGDAYAPSDT